MSSEYIPRRAHCVGCKSLDNGLKSYEKYGFNTARDMAVCAFRLCKYPATEPQPSPEESYADVYEESLCDFGQVLFKADAIAGAQRVLGLTQKEAEEYLGYL